MVIIRKQKGVPVEVDGSGCVKILIDGPGISTLAHFELDWINEETISVSNPFMESIIPDPSNSKLGLYRN